jgi:hypothetical protein
MARVEDDRPPSWLSDYGQINVDPAHLDKFAGSVDQEVEKNFKPHTDRLFTTYSYGATFGISNPSISVQAARRKHTDAMNAISQTMANYINASKILVAAMKTISERYSTSDAMSGLRSDQVNDIIGKAVADANAAQKAADDAAKRAEAEFRRNHHGLAIE